LKVRTGSAILLCGVLLVFGCSTSPKPISIKSVHNLNIITNATNDGVVLSLSGFFFNSALAIGEEKTVLRGSTLRIHLFPCLPSRNTSGKIDLTVNIPPNVNTVEFGTDGMVIWRRP